MEGSQIEAEVLAVPPSQADWRALARDVSPAYGFLGADWYDAWVEHLLPYESWRGPLRYLVAKSAEGGLRAALPMATQRQFGVAVASLGGLYWPFRAPLIAGAD